MNKQLILASKSPRRKQLLSQLGFQFECLSADIDESVLAGESAEEYVKRVAIEKAQVVASKLEFSNSVVVLGSDTSVVIDGEILGKPSDKTDFIRMFTMLSGKRHQVITGIAIVQSNKVSARIVTTDVYFKSLTEQEIENYWLSKEPVDKAGGYGIQGVGAQFVEKIDGCYFSVVGLPLFETTQLLNEFGLFTPVQVASRN